MGDPIKVSDIAEELIKRSGLKPGNDIDIEYIGLRPGEKIHEELYWQGEGILATNNRKITVLEKSADGDSARILEKMDTLKEKVKCGDIDDVIDFVKDIVPEAKISIEKVQ
jgi:FlaA1/EpsC-like NDP-sugar epimerase